MGNSHLTAMCAVGLLLAGCGASPSNDSTPSFHPSTTPPQPGNPSSQGDDEGIWFDEEPAKPLEKLVYESQRFVDDPLELRLLEGEGVDPAFVGKPDICDPRVVERLGTLGIRPLEGMLTYMDPDIYFCSYEYVGNNLDVSLSLNFPNFPLMEHVTKRHSDGFVEINDGGSEFDSIALLTTQDGSLLFSTYQLLGANQSIDEKINDQKLFQQIFINVQGGERAHI